MCALKEENNSLASYNLNTVMTVEMCNEFYKNKSFGNKYSNENDLIPKNIRDILTEMHVDEVFVTNCQHMVEFYSKCFNNDTYLNHFYCLKIYFPNLKKYTFIFV